MIGPNVGYMATPPTWKRSGRPAVNEPRKPSLYSALSARTSGTPSVRTSTRRSVRSFFLAYKSSKAMHTKVPLPNSRILIHQPSGGYQRQAADIEIQAREILDLRKRMDEIYSKHAKQAIERVHAGYGPRP